MSNEKKYDQEDVRRCIASNPTIVDFGDEHHPVGVWYEKAESVLGYKLSASFKWFLGTYAGFPTFRSRNGGRGGSIWLWDGNASTMLDRPLEEEEQSFPVRGIISAPLLVERIEKGYRPEAHDRW